jgi:ElaA protein
MEAHWYDRTFDELTTTQLYAILALRGRVFVVEQASLYQDADGLDLAARHLWVQREIAGAPGAIDAYLRIVPAGAKFDEVAFGRIVVAPEARGSGLGRTLVRKAIEIVGEVPVRIGAQTYLEKFYGDFGFCRAGEPYIEDGIPHIEMVRR